MRSMIPIEPRQMTKKRRLSFLFCLVVLICAAVRVAHYQMGGDSDSDCVWDEGYMPRYSTQATRRAARR